MRILATYMYMYMQLTILLLLLWRLRGRSWTLYFLYLWFHCNSHRRLGLFTVRKLCTTNKYRLHYDSEYFWWALNFMILSMHHTCRCTCINLVFIFKLPNWWTTCKCLWNIFHYQLSHYLHPITTVFCPQCDTGWEWSANLVTFTITQTISTLQMVKMLYMYLV